MPLFVKDKERQSTGHESIQTMHELHFLILIEGISFPDFVVIVYLSVHQITGCCFHKERRPYHGTFLIYWIPRLRKVASDGFPVWVSQPSASQ